TTLLGTAVATGGTYSITSSALADGTHTLTVTATDAAGNISTASNPLALTIDTAAPTLGAETVASPSGTDIGVGKTVTFTLATSEPVIVANSGNGLPTLQLNNNKVATYSGQTGAAVNSLIFTYLVQSGDDTPDLETTALNALPAGTTIRDAAGNDADLSGFAPVDTSVKVDTTAPTLGAESFASASGIDIGAGKVVTFTIATSEPVTVTNGGNGLPTLLLNDGRVATYAGQTGAASNSLVFSTTVQPGDAVADLRATAFNALPAGTTIRDGAGNDVPLAGFTPIDTGVQVDTTAPVASSPTLSVTQNGGTTPIGIAAPTDNGSGGLAIVAGALPNDGTVALANGSPVAAGQIFTAADLTGLTFTPTPGAFNTTSAFTYAVTDGAGNASTGTVTLAIGGPGTPSISGTVAAQTTTSEAPVRPFATTIVSDPSGGATDSITITLSGSGGTLQDGPGQSGLTQTGAATYSLAASSPSAVTADLQALAFTPMIGGSNTLSTTGFTLNVTSSTGTSVASATTTVADIDPRTGVVVDGYLAGATIFEDANGNGVLDLGEGSTTTGANGSFTLPYSPAPLVAVGGTDTSTGIANTTTLKAPSGATVVTPLTTLVSAVAKQNGGDIAAAQAAVQAAFGLSVGVDLLSLDPVAAVQAGTPGGIAAYVAAAQAQDTVALLSAAGSGTGYAAIAAAIAQSAGPIDLTSTATLTLIGSAAGLSGATLGSTVALAQYSNSSLARAAATPAGLLAAVATVETVAQGTLASALATAVSTGDLAALQKVVSNYTSGTHAGLLSFSPSVTYERGVFTLTGTLQSAGATGVDISAVVDGTPTDLGAATLNGDGTFTFRDRVGSHQQGFITATETDATGVSASSSATFSLDRDPARSHFVASVYQYDQGGSEIIGVSRYRRNGSDVVQIDAGGQTLTSGFADTFNNHGAPSTTFVFNSGYGLDSINQFRVDGDDHDTISLLGSDFHNSIAAVLHNTVDTQHGVAISDPTSGDTVRLTGITKAELVHNRQDFTFHS
ncbi:MAG: beta strand repeat-containing protein, partial [Janthinobacterium lividum]